MNGPEPPQFSNAQLIHLDSLNDIANRGQVELRKRVKQQIEARKSKIGKGIADQDEQFGFD